MWIWTLPLSVVFSVEGLESCDPELGPDSGVGLKGLAPIRCTNPDALSFFSSASLRRDSALANFVFWGPGDWLGRRVEGVEVSKVGWRESGD